MSALEIVVRQKFETETCCSCGVVFAMTTEQHEECLKRKGGKPFYCPNGHQQWFTGKSDAEKLGEKEKELLAERAKVQMAEQAKKVLEDKLARVGKGVCPECKRSFTNLRRHMNCKHPEKAGGADGKAKG